MVVSYVAALFVLFFVYLIWKLKKIFSYWEGQGIPYLTFTDYLRYLYDIFTKPVVEVNRDLYKKYGKIFGSYTMIDPALVIADPELLKQVLVKNFAAFPDRITFPETGHKMFDLMLQNQKGKQWKDTRDVMTPAFTSGKMRQMMPVIEETCQFTVENLVKAAHRNEGVEVDKLFGAYSMDVISRLSFAVKINSHKDPNNEFIKHAIQALKTSTLRLTLIVIFPKLFQLLKVSPIPVNVGKFFAKVAKKVIEQRGENTKDAVDMLQLLLNAKKDDASEDNESSSTNRRKEVLTMDSVVAQCVLFFIAGYVATGLSLTVISYYLAINPDIQDKLLQEVDTVNKNEDLTYDTLNSLQYLDAVIQEAFRISGNNFINLRECQEEVSVGGVTIKPGMRVMMLVDAIQNDPQYFPEPQKFIPERFLPENKASIQPFTFLPFGEGPRHCIGMRLAMLILKAILFKTLQRVRFTRCSETPVPLKLVPGSFNLGFNPPIKVGIAERK